MLVGRASRSLTGGRLARPRGGKFARRLLWVLLFADALDGMLEVRRVERGNRRVEGNA